MAPKTLEERHEDLRTEYAILQGKLAALSEERREAESALIIDRKHRRKAEKDVRRLTIELETLQKQTESARTVANFSMATCRHADELRYAWHRLPWTSSEVVEARDRLFLSLESQFGPVPAIQELRAPGTRAERKRRLADVILEIERETVPA